MDPGGQVCLVSHLAAYTVPQVIIDDASTKGWVDACHWVASLEKKDLAAYFLPAGSPHGPDPTGTVNSDKDLLMKPFGVLRRNSPVSHLSGSAPLGCRRLLLTCAEKPCEFALLLSGRTF